jgi:hypothetical protein
MVTCSSGFKGNYLAHLLRDFLGQFPGIDSTQAVADQRNRPTACPRKFLDFLQRTLQHIAPGPQVAALVPATAVVTQFIEVATKRTVVSIVTEEAGQHHDPVTISTGHAFQPAAGYCQNRVLAKGTLRFRQGQGNMRGWHQRACNRIIHELSSFFLPFLNF